MDTCLWASSDSDVNSRTEQRSEVVRPRSHMMFAVTRDELTMVVSVMFDCLKFFGSSPLSLSEQFGVSRALSVRCSLFRTPWCRISGALHLTTFFAAPASWTVSVREGVPCLSGLERLSTAHSFLASSRSGQ